MGTKIAAVTFRDGTKMYALYCTVTDQLENVVVSVLDYFDVTWEARASRRLSVLAGPLSSGSADC
jgi:hypothetical protein